MIDRQKKSAYEYSGSAHYFKYTNSTGRSLAIFSMPGGALRRPDFNIDPTGYDRETDRYIHFWNNLGAGHALMSSPDHLPSLGYYNDEIRGYLDDAGIEKGFFTVKMGSESSEFFILIQNNIRFIEMKIMTFDIIP